MKQLQIITILFLVSCLASCMSLAKPNIHVSVGDLEMESTQPVPATDNGDISPDGKYLATRGMPWNGVAFSLWDISKGSLIYHANCRKMGQLEPAMMIGNIPYVIFTPDGKQILSGVKPLSLWNLSGTMEKKLGDVHARIAPSFSKDGRKILAIVSDMKTHHWKDRFVILDASDGHEIVAFDEYINMRHETDFGFYVHKKRYFIINAAFSPDGNFVLTATSPTKGQASNSANIILWDARTGKKIREMTASEHPVSKTDRIFLRDGVGVSAVDFSPDGIQALSGGSDGTIRLWDTATWTEKKRIKAHTGPFGVWYVKYSRDGKNIISGGADGLLKLWDALSGAEIMTYNAFSGKAPIASFNAVRYGGLVNEKFIISGATDGSYRIFEMATGKEIAIFIVFEDGEWLVITSEGYYNASAKGARYLKVKYAGHEYAVDQFYDVFYRPDIVTAKLGGQDISGLVSLTMKDVRKYPPPLIESVVQSPGSGPARTKVCYRIKNGGGGIGEVRLFHNGKLVQSDGYYKEIARSSSEKTQLTTLSSKAIYADMRSISIKGLTGYIPVASKPKGELFDHCTEIDTIPGENEVSVAAFNDSNTIQSDVKIVKFSSSAPTKEPHLYILAIGTDRYKDSSVNLKYAVKDARDIENKLRAQSTTLYKPQNIHHELLSDSDATKTKIMNQIGKLAAIMNPQDSFVLFVAGHGVLLQNQYYMLTHDYNGALDQNSMISSNEIVEMSKKIKSLSQLFIFDTCHAGGVDKIVSGLYDARMSVLAKKMGLHIYASSSDIQTAMDGYKDNGLFSHVLLNGLNNNRDADLNKDGKVTVVGLGEYAKKATTSLSGEIGHSQTPLIINFGKDTTIYKLP